MASERTSRPEVADSAGSKRNSLAPEPSTAAARPARTGGARDGV
ncbi:hypothetical protein ABTZ58_18495 [Streptomyces sp. NPDC094143]